MRRIPITSLSQLFLTPGVGDNELEEKDSDKPKGKKKYKERGPDMTRTARTIAGVFYWDRQQNQKSNSTFSGR